MEKDELIGLLRENLGFEIEVIELYQKYAPVIRDDETRRKVLFLVQESMKHANIFRKHLMKLQFGIENEAQGLNEIELASFLEYGMKEETRMERLYRDELSKIENPEIRKDLEAIAEEEVSHAKLLRDIYDNLNK